MGNAHISLEFMEQRAAPSDIRAPQTTIPAVFLFAIENASKIIPKANKYAKTNSVLSTAAAGSDI